MVALLHEDRVRRLHMRGGGDRVAMVLAWAEHAPSCTLQAEVWNLDMLRSNHSTWPVDVSQIKQGFIMVKGHSTVSLQLTAFPALPLFLCPLSIPCIHSFTYILPMGIWITK